MSTVLAPSGTSREMIVLPALALHPNSREIHIGLGKVKPQMQLTCPRQKVFFSVDLHWLVTRVPPTQGIGSFTFPSKGLGSRLQVTKVSSQGQFMSAIVFQLSTAWFQVLVLGITWNRFFLTRGNLRAVLLLPRSALETMPSEQHSFVIAVTRPC